MVIFLAAYYCIRSISFISFLQRREALISYFSRCLSWFSYRATPRSQKFEIFPAIIITDFNRIFRSQNLIGHGGLPDTKTGKKSSPVPVQLNFVSKIEKRSHCSSSLEAAVGMINESYLRLDRRWLSATGVTNERSNESRWKCQGGLHRCK